MSNRKSMNFIFVWRFTEVIVVSCLKTIAYKSNLRDNYRMPEWRNGRRTGLKNPLLAISTRCSSLLATHDKPLLLNSLRAFFPLLARVLKTWL
jgi:hypothetical protein